MLYTIKETRPAIQEWVHQVEAESFNQAIEMLLSGEGEILDHSIQEEEEVQSEFYLLEEGTEE